MTEQLETHYELLHPHSVTDHDVQDIANLASGLTTKARVSRDGLIVATTNHRILVARHKSSAAESRSRIIGVGRLIVTDSPFTGRDAIISDVVVHKKFKGRGVGRTISKILISQAKEVGVSYVWLRSNRKRVEAHKLYNDLGFQKEIDVYIFSLDV